MVCLRSVFLVASFRDEVVLSESVFALCSGKKTLYDKLRAAVVCHPPEREARSGRPRAPALCFLPASASLGGVCTSFPLPLSWPDTLGLDSLNVAEARPPSVRPPPGARVW